MALGRVEVVTDAGRRRRYDEEEKLRLIAEAFAPGVAVADFARERGVDASLLYRWRRELSDPSRRLPAFAPVMVTEALGATEAGPDAPAPGVIEVEFVSGARVRIRGAVDPAAITAAIAALRDRRR